MNILQKVTVFSAICWAALVVYMKTVEPSVEWWAYAISVAPIPIAVFLLGACFAFGAWLSRRGSY